MQKYTFQDFKRDLGFLWQYLRRGHAASEPAWIILIDNLCLACLSFPLYVIFGWDVCLYFFAEGYAVLIFPFKKPRQVSVYFYYADVLFWIILASAYAFGYLNPYLFLVFLVYSWGHSPQVRFTRKED